MRRSIRSFFGVWSALLVVSLLPSQFAWGATTAEINASVDAALARFHSEVKGSKEFLKSAKGVLVIPNVVQAGFVVGGEYGQGALRIKEKSVEYYSLTSGSFGFQLGAQKKDIILVFLQDQALKQFRASDGWQVGVDGSVALVKGVEANLETTTFKEPIVGFVVGQKGLMYNLSLEGTKFKKLEK